jgi:hypothetical protein
MSGSTCSRRSPQIWGSDAELDTFNQVYMEIKRLRDKVAHSAGLQSSGMNTLVLTESYVRTSTDEDLNVTTVESEELIDATLRCRWIEAQILYVLHSTDLTEELYGAIAISRWLSQQGDTRTGEAWCTPIWTTQVAAPCDLAKITTRPQGFSHLRAEVRRTLPVTLHIRSGRIRVGSHRLAVSARGDRSCGRWEVLTEGGRGDVRECGGVGDLLGWTSLRIVPPVVCRRLLRRLWS